MNLIPRSNLFDLDQVFGNFFEPTLLQAKSGLAAPKVDIKESDTAFDIVAELPGVKKEDVHVHLNEGMLTIEASTQDEKTEEKNGKIIRKERYSGKMMRSFSLGANISGSDIKASFDNGLLTLKIPKREPVPATSRKIQIE